MNSVDLIVLVLVLVNGAIGAYRGFTWQVFRLGSIALAFWLGSRFAVQIADAPPIGWLEFGGTSRRVIAWVATFACTYLLMAWLGSRLKHVIERARLTSSDRSLGFLLGNLKGIVFVAIAFQILIIFAPLLPGDLRAQIWGDAEQDVRPSQAARLHHEILLDFMNDLIPEEMGAKVVEGVAATGKNG